VRGFGSRVAGPALTLRDVRIGEGDQTSEMATICPALGGWLGLPAGFRLLYLFVVWEVGTRRIVH
jgi:hypothetical protein